MTTLFRTLFRPCGEAAGRIFYRGVRAATTRGLALCLAASASGSCAAPAAMAPQERAALTSRYENEKVELKISCYFGDLYDDNEKWLLTPYPFSQTSHIVDLKDRDLHPKNERGVLPAGTVFVVERIEFPGALTNFTRMITSPRFNPWVYLRPATPFGDARDKRMFVIVLPTEDSPQGAVQSALSELLGPPGSVATWLDTLRPTVAVAIRHKDIVIGMNQAEMVAAMGPPVRWFTETASADRPAARVAWYPSLEAWLESDAIARVRPPRSPADPVDAAEVPAAHTVPSGESSGPLRTD